MLPSQPQVDYSADQNDIFILWLTGADIVREALFFRQVFHDSWELGTTPHQLQVERHDDAEGHCHEHPQEQVDENPHHDLESNDILIG